MTRTPLLFAAILMVSAMPLAAANDEGGDESGHDEGHVEGSVTWTEPKSLDDFVNVTPGSNLTVRGATLTLASGFVVQAGARLVLEEGARVVSGDPNGWLMDVQGTLEVRGTPEAPVVLDGLGGAGQNSGDTILFQGGIVVGGGEMRARHLHVVNYTSGLKAAWNSTVRLEDVLFNSSAGLGLVASQGMIEADRVTFRGRGAGYWAVADGHAEIRNSTFLDQGVLSMSINGNRTVLRDVTVNAGDICLRTTVGVLEAYNLECREYRTDGIVVSRPVKGFRMPEATFKGLRVHTSANNSTAAVSFMKTPGHVLEDAEIGPTTRIGIAADTTPPLMSNVTFRGVGTYNVAILNPQAPVAPQKIGQGEPGGEGWLFVGFPVSARILDPEGKPFAGAIFEGMDTNGTLAFRKVSPEGGQTSASFLPTLLVKPDGTVENHTYNLQAVNPQTGGHWSREGYVPDGQPLIVRLSAGQAEATNPLPAPALPLVLLAVLAALALVGGARRRP